jgi:phosphoribosylamine--glycine ligase
MTRLTSDLVDLLEAGIEGSLDQVQAEWDSRAALGVVLAADGYPGEYRKGDVITGLDADDGGQTCKTFHAGTRLENGKVVTSGGRVLCAVGLGENVTQAQQTAYKLVDKIDWQGMSYRRDIGHRAIAREKY